MAKNNTPKARRYTAVDNLKRAIRVAGLQSIRYVVEWEDNSLLRRYHWPVFLAATQEEYNAAIAARFKAIAPLGANEVISNAVRPDTVRL